MTRLSSIFNRSQLLNWAIAATVVLSTVLIGSFIINNSDAFGWYLLDWRTSSTRSMAWARFMHRCNGTYVDPSLYNVDFQSLKILIHYATKKVTMYGSPEWIPTRTGSFRWAMIEQGNPWSMYPGGVPKSHILGLNFDSIFQSISDAATFFEECWTKQPINSGVVSKYLTGFENKTWYGSEVKKFWKTNLLIVFDAKLQYMEYLKTIQSANYSSDLFWCFKTQKELFYDMYNEFYDTPDLIRYFKIEQIYDTFPKPKMHASTHMDIKMIDYKKDAGLEVGFDNLRLSCIKSHPYKFIEYRGTSIFDIVTGKKIG